jgi:hypothetical protein
MCETLAESRDVGVARMGESGARHGNKTNGRRNADETMHVCPRMRKF